MSSPIFAKHFRRYTSGGRATIRRSPCARLSKEETIALAIANKRIDPIIHVILQRANDSAENYQRDGAVKI